MPTTIQGAVIATDDRRGLAGLTVEAWSVDRGLGGRLGTTRTDERGRFGIAIDEAIAAKLEQDGADLRVFHHDREIARSDEPWRPSRDGRVMIAVDPAGLGEIAGATRHRVTGAILTRDGVGAAGLGVELLAQRLGGEDLLAEGRTDAAGAYALAYVAKAGGPIDVAVRVRAPDGGGELARSPTLFDVAPEEAVSLVIDGAQLARRSEFAELIDTLAPFLGDVPLTKLDARDVGYLAGRVQWDARLVAMAAQAARLSEQTRLPVEHHYALLRAGLPDDVEALRRQPGDALGAILKKAGADGVISADGAVPQSLELLADAGDKALRSFRPAGAHSTLGEMTAVSLGDDRESAARFLRVYRAIAQKPERLWDELADAGLPGKTIERLQLDAVLGDLTLHNAPLLHRLHDKVGPASAAALADAGLYREEAWRELIQDDLPEGVDADSYAAGLAAQVRLAHPTAVLAHRVAQGELGDDASRDAVAKFLRAGEGKHRIGAVPMHQWDGFDALDAGAQGAAHRIERLYQITPSDAAMVALDKAGIASARDVVALDEAQFAAQVQAALPAAGEAALIYRKAQAVHSTTVSVATMYLTGAAAPNLYAITGMLTKRPLALAPGTPGAATLEGMLGDMDYCACAECRSVLSPAAYFVDLLQFIDRPAAAGPPSPQAVLFARRPDLQHLLLTCENTNTAMPYVDIVNEILEHQVVQGSLAAFRGHDTAEGELSADLLADPVYVADAAYETTKQAVFPLTLPFDAPLAALRLFMAAFGTTLDEALAVFVGDGAARRELLGLTETDYRALTERGFRPLGDYYGAPGGDAAAIDAALPDAKAFARRSELGYDELAALLTTRFVNPGARLMPHLTRLGLPLATIRDWFAGTLDDAQLAAALPAGLDLAPFGGDVAAWLEGHRGSIERLIVLHAIDADDEACSFAGVALRLAPGTERLGALQYHQLHRFVRLWRKLDWPLALVDAALTRFAGIAPEAIEPATLDAAWTRALAGIGALRGLARRRGLSPAALAGWLPLWDGEIPPADRRALLAELLRMPAGDVAILVAVSGVDPLADDLGAATPALPRFLDLLDGLRPTGLKPIDLDYLLRDRDAAGTHRPAASEAQAAVKTVRDAMLTAVADVARIPDDVDLTVVRSRLGLLFDAATLDRFLGLFGGRASYRAPLATPVETLPARLLAEDPQLTLDPFPAPRQLVRTGVLTSAGRTKLEAAADALTLAEVPELADQAELDTFVAALKTALDALAAAGQADIDRLFADAPELADAFAATLGLGGAAAARAILETVMPALVDARRTAAAQEAIAALLGLDPAVAATLTGRHETMAAAGDPVAPILADLAGLAQPVAIAADGTHRLWLDPPAAGQYLLFVAAPPGTSVALEIDGVVMVPTGAVPAAGEVRATGGVALAAGVPAAIELRVGGLPAGGSVRLSWRTAAMQKGPVPPASLYADTALSAGLGAIERLRKAAALLRALPLTPRELRHFAEVEPATRGLFEALGRETEATANCARLAALAWFVALKRSEPQPDTWVAALQQPQEAGPALVAAMGWAEADMLAVLAHFGETPADLVTLPRLRRLSEALALVTTSGQAAADMVAWSVAAPTPALIGQIRRRLRDRLDPAAWRTTLQEVNDALRNRRRDALVSYILRHAPPDPAIDTPEKLYEHFLVDVAMDACMETSRIRLALSSVQLFVTRCLMNLEPGVTLDASRAEQWRWMKRYRVWEANRRIFLFPENWLEPELRDNRSPLFAELQSSLLQSDITAELAETAYHDYLKKLDEVARLEIVGSFLEERQTGNPNDDVLHLFGRTSGHSRTYYYRRQEGGYWTAWTKVMLPIEGDVLVPVVWRRQLFLFWTSVMMKPEGADLDRTPQGMADQPINRHTAVAAEVTLGWGELVRDKWVSPSGTEKRQPVRFGGLRQFEPGRLLLGARTIPASASQAERLILSFVYWAEDPQFATLTFSNKRSAPQLTWSIDLPLFLQVARFNHQLLWAPALASWTDSNELHGGGATLKVRIQQPQGAAAPFTDVTILTKRSEQPGYKIKPLAHPVEDQWEAPLFYADERAVFSITAEETLREETITYFPPVTAEPALPDFRIPPIQRRPWPGIKDPRGPIWNPGETIGNPGGPAIDPVLPGFDQLSGLVNARTQHVLGSNATVTFGGVAFDARGVAGKGRVR